LGERWVRLCCKSTPASIVSPPNPYSEVLSEYRVIAHLRVWPFIPTFDETAALKIKVRNRVYNRGIRGLDCRKGGQRNIYLQVFSYHGQTIIFGFTCFRQF
jgi:hypothetical protein